MSTRVLVLAVIAAAAVLIQWVWLAVVLVWADRRTNGLNYYGRPIAGRRGFKRTLRLHARLLAPIFLLFTRFSRFRFERASFRCLGITGPRGTCGPESFLGGSTYRPDPQDVFVVTQMRSGTTWMQHLAYQILTEGRGDLVRRGAALAALSPWLEARKGVPVDEAPLIGEHRPSRIIKTHFPIEACPWSEDARYIYVVRHPVSCFSSCVDFLAANAGSLAPDLSATEAWFCSEDMWWGHWPAHVSGWWTKASEQETVLFVRFEDMKRDLAGVVRRVNAFLAMPPLADLRMNAILDKCSFDYMRRHNEAFEMHPPHLLATDARLFPRGTADRDRSVPGDVRRRILSWCAARMAGGPVELHDLYPDPGEPTSHPSASGR